MFIGQVYPGISILRTGEGVEPKSEIYAHRGGCIIQGNMLALDLIIADTDNKVTRRYFPRKPSINSQAAIAIGFED